MGQEPHPRNRQMVRPVSPESWLLCAIAFPPDKKDMLYLYIPSNRLASSDLGLSPHGQQNSANQNGDEETAFTGVQGEGRAGGDSKK
jgi:hypothetical protein